MFLFFSDSYFKFKYSKSALSLVKLYHCYFQEAYDRIHLVVLLFSGLEPRLLTRFDCRRYTREAYDLGVRYIGGCCGFEPYHIREIAEEVRYLQT